LWSAEILKPACFISRISTLARVSLFVFAIAITIPASFPFAGAAPLSNSVVANSQTVTIDTSNALGRSVTITLTASNPNSDLMTFAIVSNPAHGTLSNIIKTDIDAPLAKVTYTPFKQYRGEDGFTFKVNDGTKDSNIANVSIEITGVIQEQQRQTATPASAATQRIITPSESSVTKNNLEVKDISQQVIGSRNGQYLFTDQVQNQTSSNNSSLPQYQNPLQAEPTSSLFPPNLNSSTPSTLTIPQFQYPYQNRPSSSANNIAPEFSNPFGR
jgi:hypothetical protein